MQLFSVIAVLLFYDSHVHMKMLALVTSSQSRVSDTQLTVVAHGPLVKDLNDQCIKFVCYTLVNLLQGHRRCVSQLDSAGVSRWWSQTHSRVSMEQFEVMCMSSLLVM